MRRVPRSRNPRIRATASDDSGRGRARWTPPIQRSQSKFAGTGSVLSGRGLPWVFPRVGRSLQTWDFLDRADDFAVIPFLPEPQAVAGMATVPFASRPFLRAAVLPHEARLLNRVRERVPRRHVCRGSSPSGRRAHDDDPAWKSPRHRSPFACRASGASAVRLRVLVTLSSASLPESTSHSATTCTSLNVSISPRFPLLARRHRCAPWRAFRWRCLAAAGDGVGAAQ